MTDAISTPASRSPAADADDPQHRQRRWRAQWLAFPTVGRRGRNGFDFWAVEPDTGVYQDDWPRGERLARDTVAHMQAFPEGGSVLRRILRDMDPESIVAQGFISHLEDALTQPALHLPERSGARLVGTPTRHADA